MRTNAIDFILKLNNNSEFGLDERRILGIIYNMSKILMNIFY